MRESHPFYRDGPCEPVHAVDGDPDWPCRAELVQAGEDIFTTSPKLVFTPTLDNYVNAFTKASFGLYYLNSVILALTSTIVVIVIGTFAAYALTSFRLRSANTIANSFFLGKLVPVISMLLPLFVIINAVGLRGTLAGPIIAHVALNLPFVVWLMMGFLRDVPHELQQAALIDGCTRMQAFWKVLFPLILPGVAAAFVLSMQYSWNELLFSLQLTNLDTYTLPVGIAGSVGRSPSTGAEQRRRDRNDGSAHHRRLLRTKAHCRRDHRRCGEG